MVWHKLKDSNPFTENIVRDDGLYLACVIKRNNSEAVPDYRKCTYDRKGFYDLETGIYLENVIYWTVITDPMWQYGSYDK